MSELINAIKQVCDEKGLSYEAVIITIESALAAAYRKDFGEKNQNIKVEFDPETAKSKVFDIKLVVEDMPPEEEEDEEGEPSDAGVLEGKEVKSKKDAKKENVKDKGKRDEPAPASAEAIVDEEEKRRFNPKTEIQISDAKLIKKTAKIDQEIKTKLPIPDAYGRMAAQTAKQVIIQKLREAERDMVFNEFKGKEHEVISGVVQRREGRVVLIDLGKAVGIILSDGQIYGEKYIAGQRIKVYVKEVNITPKGPEIILSRTSEEILKKVFYLEIPEISNGLVEIKSVAREAGSRSKVAVQATSENVDPIGSCVGQRGARIQTIIGELGGEKIDIIEYNDDINKFIANALAPAKVISVDTKEKENKALVKVAEDQLSLAIGKAGQNVRLAARLTGWKVDIEGEKIAKVEEKETSKKDKDDKDKKSSSANLPAQAGASEDKEDKKDKKSSSANLPAQAGAMVDKKATEDKSEDKKDKKKSKKDVKDKKEKKTAKKEIEKSEQEKKAEKTEKDKSKSKKEGRDKDSEKKDKKDKDDKKTDKEKKEKK